LVDGLGSAENPNWNTLSTGTYNHNIMNGRTGAKRLDLPIAQFGAKPIDLIRRPLADEDTSNPNVLAERFYTLASLRILLSDTAADITSLPGIDTSVAPIPLGTAEPTGYTISQTPPRPPFAESPGTGTTGVDTPSGTPLLGGYLKIEKQTSPGVWQDVTLEILSLGFNEPQLTTSGSTCTDYTPNAIIRLQRLWDKSSCTHTLSSMFSTSSGVAQSYTPIALFDPREALYRDTSPGSSPEFGGVMYLVDLDARNLARWFTGQISSSNCPIACSGTDALNVNGYTVYFSDRRGNRNASNEETGEYGNEDIVNTGSSGTPNGALDTGEDFNDNGVLDVYGKTPRLPFGMSSWPSSGNLKSSATPQSTLTATEARRNPPIFFRRALRLVNGQDLYDAAPGLTGLTIASENPVYVFGNWNANEDGDNNFDNDDHVATAVLADAVTLLSSQWNDSNSFANPYDPRKRKATTTSYRLAVIAGKGLSFNWSSSPKDFGTDGGAHNFLRYVESWDGQVLYYRGSIASLFYSRQATGTYKCCTTVYEAPSRGYNFDTEFLTPSLLPPRTPMFRDVNITGFQQIIRPE
jgi:hypothetical protein